MPPSAPISPRNDALSQPNGLEVSWQSIFWALVPLALNTMVQPTGQFLGLPKQYALMLRSSPIVCVVDCALVLITLIRFIWQGSSISTAVRQLTVSRFQGSTDTFIRDNSLAGLLENPWLRLFLFVGGTLPQTIKLYGFCGVPWTKALASMYLVPILIFEVIAFIDRTNQDEDVPPQDVHPQNVPPQNIPPQNIYPQNIPPQNVPPQDEPLAQESIHHDVLIWVARISGCLAIAMQVSLWFIWWYMVYAESYEMSQQEIRQILHSFSLFTMLMMPILDQCIERLDYVPGFFHLNATLAVRSIVLCTKLIFSLGSKINFVYFSYVAYLADDSVRARCAYIVRPIDTVCSWTGMSFLLSFSYHIIRRRFSRSLICRWLAWHFLVSNFAFAYSYYVLAWDPHGTVAPGWTTYLG